MRLNRPSLLAVITLLGSACLGPARAKPATDELVIYVDSQARTPGSGLSRAAPLNNLADSEAVARKAYAGQRRIRVEIAPGTYRGQTLTWRWRPQDPMQLTVEGEPGGPRPLFDGEGNSDTWTVFIMSPPPSSDITVRHVSVTNYRQGVVFSGRGGPSGIDRHETVEDNHFQHIGKLDPEGENAFAVVGFGNTSDSVIRNNTFVDIANVAGCRKLHAIYMAHNSSNNLIQNNRFEDVCGDVIKVRDGSNNNRIVDNQFVGQHTRTMVVDSYCDPQRVSNCRSQHECPSVGNVVQRNSAEPANILPHVAVHRADVPGCLSGERFLP